MSAGDRAWFVQELIAALQEQSELVPVKGPGPSLTADRHAASGGSRDAERAHNAQITGLFVGAGLPPARADFAAAAYDQLQFDFPQVADRELTALAEMYRSFASSAVSDGGSVADFALTRPLVEGVAYLTERGDGGTEGARKSEASGELAAAVLLELVRYCVEKRGSPKARALLAKLVVPVREERVDLADQYNGQQQASATEALPDDVSAFEEKYAAEEDPEDLGEVYEGNVRVGRPPASLPSQPTLLPRGDALSERGELEKRLHFLATRTFSSSFAALSVDKWLDWGLDDVICSLIRHLLETEGDGSAATKDYEMKGQSTSGESALFGASGEWTRYLYILRDRLLRFPASSQHGIRSLTSLIKHFQASRCQYSSHKQSEAASKEETAAQMQPHHAVYRVLAELVVSKEFQQRSSQRAQESLATATYELLPLIVEELQRISRSHSQRPPFQRLDGRDGDLIVIFLQLLHFIMLTASNARAMAQNLHESGVLRTMLTLLPATTAPTTQEGAMEELAASAWSRPFFRLIGECALWHEGVAVYISRVPRAAGLLPILPAALPAEAVVLSFAFHQHRVGAALNVWGLFASPALFPLHCDSFLNAMEKLQDAIFVLDALATAVPGMRASIQAELRQNVQKVYVSVLPDAFKYPLVATSANTDTSAPSLGVKGEKEPAGPSHEGDRGRTEAMRLVLLRNKLRQAAKGLLLALSPDPGGAAGKLD